MRKFYLSLICVLIIGRSLSGQAGRVDFETFARELREKHNIYLYYKPEWVKDIRVNTSLDSLNIENILKEVLDPAGIGFIKRGQNQFFITGTAIINRDSLATVSYTHLRAHET